MSATLTVEIVRLDGGAQNVELTPDEFESAKKQFDAFIKSEGADQKVFIAERAVVFLGGVAIIRLSGS
jgi:hypothetical protein